MWQRPVLDGADRVSQGHRWIAGRSPWRRRLPQALSPDGKWVLTPSRKAHLVLLPTGAGSAGDSHRKAISRECSAGAWLDGLEADRLHGRRWQATRASEATSRRSPDGDAPRDHAGRRGPACQGERSRNDRSILGRSAARWLLYPVEGGEPQPVSVHSPPRTSRFNGARTADSSTPSTAKDRRTRPTGQ